MQIFVHIVGEMMTSKILSEIYWPLVPTFTSLLTHHQFVSTPSRFQSHTMMLVARCSKYVTSLINQKISDNNVRYGNTSCLVFKRGVQNWKDFLPKNQHTQRKLLNFENWCNEEVSKSALIWLSKSIFYVKNHKNLSHFFHWRISI